MAKTRTGRSNKKLKTDPMGTLLEFKRHPAEDVQVVEEQVVEVEQAEEQVEEEMQVDGQVEVITKLPEITPAAIPVEEAEIPAEILVEIPVVVALETPLKLSDSSLTTLLAKSNEKYTALLSKYTLLESLSHQNHLDEYKSLHQDRLVKLESTIEMLTNERGVLQEQLRNCPSDGISPRRVEEMVNEIEALKKEVAVFKDKSNELESTVKLYASKQTSLEAEIKELRDQNEAKTRDLDQVVQDRTKIVEELKSVTTLLTDQTALAGRLEETYQKMRLEKSDLEAALGQTSATLAKLQATSGNAGIGKLLILIV
jgi:DNA repair exonuclease SbcCD ATPase subunit